MKLKSIMNVFSTTRFPLTLHTMWTEDCSKPYMQWFQYPKKRLRTTTEQKNRTYVCGVQWIQQIAGRYFRSRLSSLSLCTLQTTAQFSLSWPMLARSQVFKLRSALKLLSDSHEDTGNTIKILISTSTWSNYPCTSTGSLLRTYAASPMLYLLRKRQLH